MKNQLTYEQYSAEAARLMPKNAFMTTASGDKTNTMTIGWGSVGIVWRKPVFTVLVRQSRYTKGLVDQSNEFTVTLPLTDMKEALSLCGTKSGRDMDKIAAAKLTLSAGQALATPVIAIPGLHLECKVLYKETMKAENLDPATQNACYADGDYHTLYFGEIVAAYKTE
ncbi:flavin reductase family protein [Sporomusa acidovorans]|uniref:Flavin reductase like domain-containing protein n=1 Tax=Sporomusa acidovorans (strain ATCC 49682 / DSM 3132 / Mol) TaxID=1123286 RepID=A0ABZ3IWI6_SPOA4|nr:flavin reductase family protein [Sporomusa acidovorans]OZC17975.1 flavoredoxin [Sporomusa acidovorans DSM 3132]SDF41901.1 Flavin reductase like domain-containing protein [Sporomusa acidovorans]